VRVNEQHGCKHIVLCQKSGLNARILVPRGTPQQMIDCIGLLGAEVNVVDGGYFRAAELA
jgi:threonine dehydratase